MCYATDTPKSGNTQGRKELKDIIIRDCWKYYYTIASSFLKHFTHINGQITTKYIEIDTS